MIIRSPTRKDLYHPTTLMVVVKAPTNQMQTWLDAYSVKKKSATVVHPMVTTVKAAITHQVFKVVMLVHLIPRVLEAPRERVKADFWENFYPKLPVHPTVIPSNSRMEAILNKVIHKVATLLTHNREVMVVVVILWEAMVAIHNKA
jgi:hypothetical protein